MKIYLVIEDVDAYPEEGGGEYPVAIFELRQCGEIRRTEKQETAKTKL